jgi:hypothetical protein
MRLEQLMLVIAGLMGLGAFFLPFLHIEQSFMGAKLMEVVVSGYSYTTAWLDYFDLYQTGHGKAIIEWLTGLWENASGLKGYAQLAGLFMVLTGPVWYALFSLGYLFRGLTGRSFKRGILFNFLFMALSWAVFFWISQDKRTVILGQEIGLDLNFFSMAGPGYWVAFVAVFVAGFSLLFEKKA